jgi:hypothetical protein
MIALASKRRLSIATWNIAAINNNVSADCWIETSKSSEIDFFSTTKSIVIAFFDQMNNSHLNTG